MTHLSHGGYEVANMETSNEHLASDINKLKSAYPDFEVVLDGDGGAHVEGKFEVWADGRFIDSYLIRVEIDREYPATMPKVFEVGGGLKRDADRHINPDGSACLFVPDARWKHWPVGSDLVSFLKGPVYYFFLSQAFFDLEGRWLFGDRPHGDEGVIDYFREELEVDTFGVVYKCLDLAVNATKLARNMRRACVCGSAKILDDCHRIHIQQIAKNTTRERLFEVMGMLKCRRRQGLIRGRNDER